MKTRRLFCAAAAAALLATAGAAQRVALRVGTAHLVEEGEVLRGGATVLVEDGVVVAVGRDVEVPPDAQLFDYGPDSVLVPGLVAADSSLVEEDASRRTADPQLRAIDAFDFYANHADALAAGVTSAYLAPARTRLVAGQGAVVKLGAGESGRRVLASPAAVHGAISAEARRTPDFWEPPIPATSDVGIGVPRAQLPRTTMGAVVALDELLAIARSGEDDERYGPGVAASLGALLEAGVPWRITARDEDELRALLAWRAESGVALVVHGADDAARVADELAAAGVSVVYETAFRPNRDGEDRGRSPDADWPDLRAAATLAAAGVPVAVAGAGGDLRFAAALASRGGLGEALALRAITLTPAEVYGVAARVGSVAPGKDADFCVLNGAPFEPGTSVLATWVGGDVAWKAHASSAVVVEVEELHVGDGTVLRPGALLMRDGVLVEVGEAVARPAGAQIVRGFAALPGLIDALGHLGLEGTKKTPSADFEMRRIVGPGDAADRRVARSGVTTVCLSPREGSRSGTPILAYKPAAGSDDRQIVGDPVALRLEWTDRNRYESGDKVRRVLEQAVEYHREWEEYERELEAWRENPPAPEDDGEEDVEDEEDGDSEEGSDDGEGDDEGDGDEAPEPLTGLWEGELERAPFVGPVAVRLRLLHVDEPSTAALAEGRASDPAPRDLSAQDDAGGDDDDGGDDGTEGDDDRAGSVRGSLRCEALSDDLVAVEGWFGAGELSLRGLGSQGYLRLDLELEQPDEKQGRRRKKDNGPEPARLRGTVQVVAEEIRLELERTALDYAIVRRARTRGEAEPEADEPEGMPDPPRVDGDLEPLRRAIDGRATVVVSVEREDEVLECVEAFRGAGIRPVLLGARGAHHVADRIAPHVAGVLPVQPVVADEPERGTDYRNRYAELQAAGIRVAFASRAEEGAVDLPLMAAYAVSRGMSPAGALRALTADAAAMFSMEDRVGVLRRGRDADVVLMDGSPLDPRSSVSRVWVNGEEVR